MDIEIRADGTARISGYVNATEKKSRPVMTPHGRVVEEIEPRAFERAIERAGCIAMTVDHGDTPYASTEDRTLSLYEDGIGLHAEAVVTDAGLVSEARAGKIRGWSFGMRNVKDTLESRADELPLRRVSDLDLDHITLVVRKTPAYSATSVEVRAEGEVNAEERFFEDRASVRDNTPAYDNQVFKQRLEALRK